jgi:IPT/TIG domain-containing protein
MTTTTHARRLARTTVAMAAVAAILVAAAPPAAAAVPTVSSFSPGSGPVGTSVQIFGSNFTSPTATIVKFNGVNASFSIVNDGQITAAVPSGATTGEIKVKNADGSGLSSTNFVVTGTSSQPSITSFSPGSGPVGTTVTINGTNFGGTTSVSFNGVNAPGFNVNNVGTRITVKVPANATTGRITVTTPAGTATSANNFNVTGATQITSFSPTSGPPGTKVEIFGRRFTGATSVRFNGVSAGFTVNAAGTKITATVPSGATTGKISVTTPQGTFQSAGVFTVTSAAHGRRVSLNLSGHLVATGRVVATDGYNQCERNVPVVIKRLRNGRWRWVETTSTRENGSFRARLRDRRGQYRARARRIVLANGAICRGDRSDIRFHRH